ncbi:MAG TPA: hypothetical protein VF163_04635 [Micromonosporaceae bacterium]
MSYRGALAVAAGLLVSLAACGGEDASSGNKVALTATDTTCEVATTSFSAGKQTFAITNKGNQVTEVYVYGEQDGKFNKVVSELENIGPGLTRDLTVDLTGGVYELACKPGQTGDGIRTRITVTGGSAASPTAEAAYDREIEIVVTATGVAGADGLTARAGERIEFKLENKAAAKRELEIIDPTGKVVAEIEADPNGAAETIVTLASAGAWKVKVEGGGMAEVERPLTVS